MSNVRCVNFALLASYPKWILHTIPAPTYYYNEVLTRFRLVEDARFVAGWTFFCRDCDIPVECEEVYADGAKVFVVRKLVCRWGCGARWVAEDLEPLWVRAMEDWEE